MKAHFRGADVLPDSEQGLGVVVWLWHGLLEMMQRPDRRWIRFAMGVAIALPALVGNAKEETLLREAARKLGSDRFDERQQAMDLLWSAGAAAEPVLRSALSDRDPEVRLRALSILDRFRYGIFDDTPPDIVRLIDQYRHGDLRTRRVVITELVERQSLETMLALRASETNRELLVEWEQHTTDVLTQLLPRLIVEGSDDEVERLLGLAATYDDGMRHWAAFLQLKGKLGTTIAELRGQEDSSTLSAKRLAYALRAHGDLSAARDAAARIAPEFQLEILLEQRDWPAAARVQEMRIAENPAVSESSIEAIGYAAALHRLAGNEGEFARRLATVRMLAEKDLSSDWYCAEALLINGHFNEALDVLREGNPYAVFQLLCFQLRYREAFELLGVDYPDGFDLGWFQSVATMVDTQAPEAKDRFRIAVQATRILFSLGRREQALQALDVLADAVSNDRDGRRCRQLCEMEFKLGLVDLALEHAALSLSKEAHPYALNVLFPDQSDVARIWWDYFLATDKQLTPRQRLNRIWMLLGRSLPSGSAGAENFSWQATVDAAAAYAGDFKQTQRKKWMSALAETCRLRGDRQGARRYLEATAETSAESALRVGDLSAEQEDWLQAAHWYGQAWKIGDLQPLALYLQGQALIRAGQVERGCRLCEDASLIPLATRTRHELAKGLKERGYVAEAIEQWRLVTRTGPFRDWYVVDAAKDLGNALNGVDCLEAAAQWESMLLSCLKTSSAFVKIEGYVQIPHLIHKTRARGLLAAGRTEEAIEELRLSHAIWPTNVSLAEDMIPLLDDAGCDEFAAELFTATSEQLQRICDDFPQSATHHNNLAWMSARCDRDLDNALKHALRAVQLAPGNYAYLDTLGEVHFRRGHVQEALRCARECLEAVPDNPHYQRQMDRFRAAAQNAS
jgi:tetratricopeptide (TPR) repeat protein